MVQLLRVQVETVTTDMEVTMGNERNTEMDSGILYFTTILDDMWRGFKKFFLLCFLLMAVCGGALYLRE